MMELIDSRLAPSLWLLGDWSLRWGALIVALMAWFAIRPPRTAAVRMLALRLAVIAGLLLPIVPRFWGTALPESSSEVDSNSPAVNDIGNSNTSLPAGTLDTVNSPKSVETSPPLRIGNDPIAVDAPSDHSSNANAESTSTRTREPLGWIPWLVVFLSIGWVLGLLAANLRLAVGWYWLAKLRRSCTLIESEIHRREFEQCCVHFRVTRNANLATHSSVNAPIIIGGLRPFVLVPSDWQSLSTLARRAILLHELAHIQRRDDIVRLFDELIRAFFWFHPLVHCLLNRIDSDREELCDAAAVTRGIAPRELANVLIECCQRCGAGKPSLALSAALPFLRRRSVKDRIQILMEENSMSRWTVRPSHFAIAFLLVAITGISTTVGGFGAKAEEQAQLADAAEVAPGLPSPTEILAAYRENFARMMPLALTYRLTQTVGQGEIEADRAQLKQNELLLNFAKNTTSPEFDDWSIDGRKPTAEEAAGIRRHVAQVPEEIADLKRRLEPESVKRRLAEPMIDRYYVWTDGKSFHARWPKIKAAEETSLVRGPLTPAENLATLYGSFELTSWTKSNSPPFRCFGSNQGRIAQRLDDCISMNSFAPLGLVNLDWTQEYDFHDLDTFMSHDAADYKVVKRDSLNGKSTMIVDGFFTPAGKNGFRERWRAWVDPNQGYLPLRIERAHVNSANAETGDFDYVVDVLQVREVAGGYYPAQVRRQRLQYDYQANEKQRQEKEAGRLPADAPAPPQLPGRTYTWEVTEITPHQPVESGALELEFPKGAMYVNAVENRSYRVGDPDPLPEFKPLQAGDAAPPFQIAAWTDGKTHSLEELHGKVVFINFWQMGIPETKQMLAMLKNAYAKYADKGVVFVEIYKSGTDVKQLRAHQQEQKWDAFLGVDNPLKEQSGATAFAYNLVPGTFAIVGRDGKMAFLLSEVREEAYRNIELRACRALSIPWPIDENGPAEQVATQQFQIFGFMIGEQLDKALGKP